MRFLMFAIVAMMPAVALAEGGSSVGEREFNNRCASCHGMNGKGNGPVAELLSVGLPDLTTLATRNDGKFPYDRVFQLIDGRMIIGAHGTREMPVWGDEFNDAAIERYNDFPGSVSGEVYVAGRILSITKHLQSMQTP